MKKLLLLVYNFVFLAVIAILLGLVIAFVWNTAFIWILPVVGNITVLGAIGLSATFIIVHMLVDFWIGRFIQLRAAKSLEALLLVNSLEQEIKYIHETLENKDIL